MSDLKILETVQAIGNSDEELEQLLQELNNQVEYVSKSKKFYFLTYEAMIRQNRLKDYAQAYRILKTCLELPNPTMQQIVQTHARIVMNRFQLGLYNQCKQESAALQLYTRRNDSLKSIVYNIFCGQGEKTPDGLQIKSVMMEIEGRIQEAAKLQEQAFKLYDKQGINAIKQRKFSQFRLSKLSRSQVSSIKLDEMNDMEVRNQVLKKILRCCSNQNDSVERKTQKQQILQKMLRICQTNSDPANNQKNEKIKEFMREFKEQEMPASMKGTYSILNRDDPQESMRMIPQSVLPRSKQQVSQKMQPQPDIPNTFSQLDFIPEEDMEYWEGSDLIKLNFSSSGQDRRYFYLQDNKMFYCSKKSKKSKDDEYYPLKGLIDMKLGKMTETMIKKEHQEKDENLCFSLQYSDRTRDFCALNEVDFRMWVSKIKEYLDSKKMKKSIKKSKLQSELTRSEQPREKGVLFMSKKF